MKKIFLFIAAILFGVTASFAQVDIVRVSWIWDATTCDCESAIAGDYFKVTVSIYDDANSTWVVQNRTVTEPIGTPPNYTKDVDVPEVDTYCHDTHDFTPSFTIYAWVWMIDDDTNPPTECCSNSNNLSENSCHEFYNGIIGISVGTLN
jgi:hypothetical protein